MDKTKIEDVVRDCANVLGTKIDRLHMTATIEHVEELIAAGKPQQHVVVNAAKLVAMQRDQQLADIVHSCMLVNADGQAVVWASRILGDPLPCRVAGIDLMIALLGVAEQKAYRTFFLGATEEVVNKVIEVCLSRHPDLQISGWHCGYFDETEEQEIVQNIRLSNSDILFLAMGTPQKEYWLAKYKDILNVPFCMGVGGSFDVVAGKVKRAPVWMQQCGLEWFHRFLQEPRRMWKRYLVTNSVFLWMVFKGYIRQKWRVAKKTERGEEGSAPFPE